MQLKKDPLALAGDGAPKRRIDIARAGAQVKKVDAVVDCGANNLLDLCIARLLDAAHTQAEHAEIFLPVSVRKVPIFHIDSLLSSFFITIPQRAAGGKDRFVPSVQTFCFPCAGKTVIDIRRQQVYYI